MLTTAHAEKEHAAGNFKKGYGHHPLLCYLDATGEAMAGVLRAGNAGSNTATLITTMNGANPPSHAQLERRSTDGLLGRL